MRNPGKKPTAFTATPSDAAVSAVPVTNTAEPVDVELALPEELPAWDEWEARRHRTLLFLLFAGIYVGFVLLSRWVEYPLFRADTWYYFGREPPPWFEIVYRFVLTFLPVAAWIAIVFLCLSQLSFLTHRRVALFIVLVGLAFFEADMRWFHMSRRHVSLTEIRVFFSVDATRDLGLRESDYWTFIELIATHFGVLLLCALAAGPELKGMFWAVLNGGPAGKTFVGHGLTVMLGWTDRAARWLCAHRSLLLLDNKFAVILLIAAITADPVIIWALETQEEELEESRSIVREIAETNPLRWHSLDRFWEQLVHRFSDKYQDIAAANAALARTEPTVPSTSDPRLRVVDPRIDKPKHNVVLIQVESLNADVFANTNLPTVRRFAEKSLNLKRHFASANCTHYGILGFLHGAPVSFYDSRLLNPWNCAYLEAFKDNGYRTRAISMKFMDHHYLGDYLPNWTEPVYQAGNDWHAIPEFHRELDKPGPRMIYLFYHFTHYPYRPFNEFHKLNRKYQPEVPEKFQYDRSDLVLYKDQIINRYKNTLDEFDGWLERVFERIDWDNTIVALTGDHGEELLEQGRLGHCSSLNKYQTMPPCYVYVPGIPAGEVNFTTSHADIMPSVADALGWETKPDRLGRSIFTAVPYRFALVANFEYRKPLRWAVVTEDRKTLVEETNSGDLEIFGLVDWEGRRLTFRDQAERWTDNLRIVKQLEADIRRFAPRPAK